MPTDKPQLHELPRHEYFRRTSATSSATTSKTATSRTTKALVGQMVKNICDANAKAYLGLARS
ncbi:MAG: glucuronate isomerase [Verrucomicrobiaceae bacterium]|nr:glucuronate isomerase [Verrucomicrobiaceae bacterium]